MKVGFYEGVRKKSRKSRKSRKSFRGIGAASKACKGLGKRARKACMSKYMKRGKK